MSDELAYDLSPFIRVYKDGRVVRLVSTENIVRPSFDPKTGVQSIDLIISSETGLSARLYIPKTTINTTQKLPLLVYFHGGCFCIGTAFSATFHNYLNSLVSLAKVVAVSVEYRRAPEHPIPAAYDDSWEALKWVDSHVEGKGSSEWLNSHADLDRVFLAGDSAGANISNNLAIRLGLSEETPRIKLRGIVLVHPYFCGKEPIGKEANKLENKAYADGFWSLASPSSAGGSDDPLINPEKDPNLGRLGCRKVLVCVAEKDFFKDRGLYYYELLKTTGWGGDVEIMEAKGEDHVFHLMKSDCDEAISMLNKIVSFINSSEG